ncbi:MAG: PTS transporter subunit EIIC [Lachnospiraceae bacterium]|nr:PTS transporter subunit EIIC [Lachnospiraceae bacterium]
MNRTGDHIHTMKEAFFKRISVITATIRVSLAMVIPVLFIGSCTVLLNSFPIRAYQSFLDSYLNGALRSIILTVQMATVGLLAVYITIALSFSYRNQTESRVRPVSLFGSLLGCLTGFFILSGFLSGEPDLSMLSGQGVFSALLSGMIGSILFGKFEAVFKTRRTVFVEGADSAFNAALRVILPFLCVTLCFACANYLITLCFHVQSVQHLFMKAMAAIFSKASRSYGSGLLFTTLISIMWWFGIHGNNVLDQVATDMFAQIIPGQIVSKSFIDTFVNMGGTGCALGLLFAMMLCGKRNSTKKLSGMAFVPGIFNISELLVFGFPVIYNPVMALPFILAPTLCFSNAFLLTQVGWLPPVTTSVTWTTPALMSGYLATGSVRGILAQVLNILISTACYAPFVILCEKKSLNEFSAEMDGLLEILQKSETSGEEAVLTEWAGNTGRFARLLAIDLEEALSSGTDSPLLINYRFLTDDAGHPVRAEALPEWKHIRHGIIFPPLVIKLAEESGDLYSLETFVLKKAVSDAEGFRQRFGEKFVVSVPLAGAAFRDKRFISFLQSTADHYKLRAGNICLKIPAEELEKSENEERLAIIRGLGYEVDRIISVSAPICEANCALRHDL